MSVITKDEKKLQKGMIITDDISHFPILDFNDYVNALSNIIKNSYPKFSIGIYGEWGTGKTTLMRAIYNKLKEDNEKNSIIPVWFNPWRYEREEQFAIMPLLKTIAYDIPEEKQFEDLKQKIKKGGINFLKKIPDIIPSIVGTYFGEGAKNITDAAINSLKEEIIPKLELLAEVDKDTIYFDGLENIQKELLKIRTKNDYFKIVVFVDDLDRCSPDKALRVLESIKVFLDIDGFIYVIGLSFNKISQLITAYYKDKYKDIGIEGDQYLKKIIQIPLILSDWNSDDIKTLIQDFITNNVIENQDYQKIVEENIDLISTGLEENPREVKRFLNNFIVAQEIFSQKGIKPKELLVLQILNMRWNEIYRIVVNSNGKYLDKLVTYIKDTEELKKLRNAKPEDLDIQPELKILHKFSADQDFWDFVGKNYGIMKQISNWSVYRRATKIGEQPQTEISRVGGKIHDKEDNPLEGIHINAFEHDPLGAHLMGKGITDSYGSFDIVFDREVIDRLRSRHKSEGTISVFLVIEDPNREFLHVFDRRNDRQTMYVQLTGKGGNIAWKGNVMEISSDSYEFDILVEYFEKAGSNRID
jgi:predicted KAP-like P-loop ATPase